MPRTLQSEIDKLKKRMLYLGTEVEENVQRSVKSIMQHDTELATKVIKKDIDIDRLEIDVEEACLRILALYQPVAGDLRFLVTVLKINNDLERIGDLAAKISDKVLLLSEIDAAKAPGNGIQIPEIFQDMYEKTIWMLKSSLDAFVNEDADLAYKVCLTDDEVDEAKRIIREQLEEILQKDPTQHVYLAKVLSVARSLERIADHCTNICEDLIYMMQGKIIRHHDVL